MKTIYIDAEFRCHMDPGEGRRAVQEAFFEDKCAAFVEGYRFVPKGSVWQRSDGKTFAGPMITPFRDHRILEAYQAQYEAMRSGMEV